MRFLISITALTLSLSLGMTGCLGKSDSSSSSTASTTEVEGRWLNTQSSGGSNSVERTLVFTSNNVTLVQAVTLSASIITNTQLNGTFTLSGNQLTVTFNSCTDLTGSGCSTVTLNVVNAATYSLSGTALTITETGQSPTVYTKQ